ncbi:MAG: holo-ACP synthase, partial [Verrucomicrobiota bacterium]
MNPETPPGTRCGIDTVEIARVEKFLLAQSPEGLAQIFSATELQDAGTGTGRTESLAARFAAKEACCKLFPKETALGTIQPTDFSVRRDGYGAPQVEVSANAQAVLDRHRLAKLRVSLTHTS